MSGQDIGFFDVGTNCPDLVIEDGDLKADDGLETAVLISLFSDRRVEVDELPNTETPNRGWWGDELSEPADDKIGSGLWVTERGKIDADTEAQLEDFARQSLQWLIDDGIAQSVTAVAENIDGEQIDLLIEITQPQGNNRAFKFIWDGQELRQSEEI